MTKEGAFIFFFCSLAARERDRGARSAVEGASLAVDSPGVTVTASARRSSRRRPFESQRGVGCALCGGGGAGVRVAAYRRLGPPGLSMCPRTRSI
jgi:hypothetical protein